MTSAVVFAYSEVGVRCVRELLAQGIHIPLLFSHADDPNENQWFGSVQRLAQDRGLHIVTPDSPNTPEWLARGAAIRPDFVFSFYYRYMLDKAWLSLPRLGALNIHGSLLPKYRGRAPVHWAIINGESTTGASLHYMVEKPDAGALVDQEAVPILENDNALEVSMKVAAAAETVLRRSLPRLIAGTASATPLDLPVGSYFGRRRPEDGRIDWRGGARAVHDLVRAVAPPFPGAFTEVNGCRVGVLETRLDPQPLKYPGESPCLYTSEGAWYADCVDGRRLKILQLTVNDRLVAHNTVPPALSKQPLALS
ncbi:MAG: methionyl-tRNA formyltransferase [Gammaproteobacteria bacterium]|nr:methionyl-tRNA formyltransferase [Gammaproteobacteria bacterium]